MSGLGAAAVHRPRSLDEALGLLAEPPDGRKLSLLAGGTDLMVVLQSGDWKPEAVLDLWSLRSELSDIFVVRDGSVQVGALATYREIVRSSVVADVAPALVEASKTVGAAQIQARGTLGGNVANGSPAGDTLPVLSAHGATVVLRSRDGGQRHVDFDSFYAGYRQPDIRPGELITALRIKPVPRGGTSRFRKVGTRLAQAISKVVMCSVGSLDADGRIATLRIAAGSVAPTVVRLRGAEAAAIGHRPGDVLDAVHAAAAADVAPIDDVRSNAGYRREITARLARRCVQELAGS